MLCHSISVFFPFEPMNLRGFLGRKFDDFYLLQQIFSKNRFGTLPKKKKSTKPWYLGWLQTDHFFKLLENNKFTNATGIRLRSWGGLWKTRKPPQPKNKKDHWTLVCWFDWKNLPIFQGTKISFWSLKKWSAVLHTMSQKTVDASEIPRSPVWYVECTD